MTGMTRTEALAAVEALIVAAKNWCPVCGGNGWLRGPTTTKCRNCYVLILRADDAIAALRENTP